MTRRRPGPAAGFSAAQLASIGRVLTYNDPQVDVAASAGEPTDRNVELLLDDPRATRPADPKLRLRVKPRRVRAGRRTRLRFRVRSAGQPVKGAVVRFKGRRKRTNAKGVARMQGRCGRQGAPRACHEADRLHEAPGERSRPPALAPSTLGGMCRNIRTLHNFEPPATEEEIRASALQYVRKVSGSTKPSQANEEAFDRAVDEVAEITTEAARLARDQRAAEEPRGRGGEAARARREALRRRLSRCCSRESASSSSRRSSPGRSAA